jgi:hypothetical protein
MREPPRNRTATMVIAAALADAGVTHWQRERNGRYRAPFAAADTAAPTDDLHHRDVVVDADDWPKTRMDVTSRCSVRGSEDGLDRCDLVGNE